MNSWERNKWIQIILGSFCFVSPNSTTIVCHLWHGFVCRGQNVGREGQAGCNLALDGMDLGAMIQLEERQVTHSWRGACEWMIYWDSAILVGAQAASQRIGTRSEVKVTVNVVFLLSCLFFSLCLPGFVNRKFLCIAWHPQNNVRIKYRSGPFHLTDDGLQNKFVALFSKMYPA